MPDKEPALAFWSLVGGPLNGEQRRMQVDLPAGFELHCSPELNPVRFSPSDWIQGEDGTLRPAVKHVYKLKVPGILEYIRTVEVSSVGLLNVADQKLEFSSVDDNSFVRDVLLLRKRCKGGTSMHLVLRREDLPELMRVLKESFGELP